MADKQILSPDLLRQLIDYDPMTGLMVWRARNQKWFSNTGRGRAANAASWNTRYAGTPALRSNAGRGYLGGRIFDVAIKAHRAAWVIYYGDWPRGQIDHINHVRDDNKIENLRDVSASGNRRNMSLSPKNTSGYNGVSWCKKSRKWEAHIKIGHKKVSLGYFLTIEDAVSARAAANLEHGFHPNHGFGVAGVANIGRAV